MISQVAEARGLRVESVPEKATETRVPEPEPTLGEYLKFLAVAGAVAAGFVVGPMLGMAAVSLLVTLFGWLTGGLTL